MADDLKGLSVRIRLKKSAFTLHGKVADAQPGRLWLKDIIHLETGESLQDRCVHGEDVEEIEVVSGDIRPAVAAHKAPSRGKLASQHAPMAAGKLLRPAQIRPFQLKPSTAPSFPDPAILSYQRTPVKNSAVPAISQVEASEPLTTVQRSAEAEVAHQALDVQHVLASPATSDITTPAATGGISAALSAPFNALQLNAHDLDAIGGAEDAKIVYGRNEAELEHDIGSIDGKGKRRRRRRGKKTADPVDDVDSSPEAKRNNADISGQAQHGWRQTPILTPQSSMRGGKAERMLDVTESKAARVAVGTSRKHQRALDKEASKNGWGTEDASDVRDLPDFDFEDNLNKFDKKAVWEELRAGDTTADEDRLVSFNRVTTPGTFGGQKLHPTENVLDSIRKPSYEVEDEESDFDLNARPASTSQILRREASRASFVRQPPSRKDSLQTEVQATAPSMANRTLSRQKLAEHAALSPRIPGLTSPPSSAFSPAGTNTGPLTKPHLRYVTSNRPCRTATPETLQSVENLAQNGFAMSDDILAENAGRGIAEIVLSTLDPTDQRLGRTNHNALPVVVMLIGERKAGARALAAARHLLERNIRVIAALTGAVDLQHGPLSLQVQRIRGKIIRSWTETSAHLKTLDAPPELIVDAILGAGDTFETMSPEHFDTTVSMFAWANKSRASVLSVDVPSGVDPTSGAVQMREGEPFEIRSKVVVCCGIPVVGLVEAMAAREHEEVWRIFVVDIGLNPAARPFMKIRTKDTDDVQKDRFVQFGSDWVIRLRFDECAS